tara:strand:- start:1473 stop:1691 length:219 start_codon:yes stop_codon:yes gene_type:complete
MIDTDKYERTTPELEEFEGETLGDTLTNLLAEVKRLRERLIRAYDWAENAVNGNDSAMMDYTEYVCGGEEND